MRLLSSLLERLVCIYIYIYMRGSLLERLVYIYICNMRLLGLNYKDLYVCMRLLGLNY